MPSDKVRSKPSVRALVLAQTLILLASLSLPAGALAAVTGVTPNSQAQGTTQSIVVNGSGSTFPGGAYTITFSGTGVTASGVSRASAIALNATVTVTAGAATGARTLTVNGPGGFGGPQTTTYTIIAGTIATTTTITSDAPDPSTVGAAVSVGITVAAASGTTSPTGTVTVSDGTATSAPCALSGSGGSATATCTFTPTTSGPKTLTATYGGNSSFGGSAVTTAHTVLATQAALVLTGTSSPAAFGSTQTLGTTGGSGTGAVTYTSSTPATCTISGNTLSITSGTGTCSVYATKAADTTYSAATSATVDITIDKANQAALVLTGTSSPATYGSTQTLGTTGGSGTGAVTYSTGASTACSVVGNTLTITASTGTCSVTATKAADTAYNATTSASVAITPAKAVLTVTPDPQAVTFGQAVPTYTFSATGFVPGENAGNAAGYVAPTCASAYTPAAPVADSPLTITCSGGSATNYTFNTTATAQLTIDKSDAACSVSGYSGTYDGTSHGATGECLGVLGETLAGLDLGSTFTNVPGGTADWTFTDVTGNYNDDAGSVAIDITQASQVCSVSGVSVTYDGTSHGATGECLGVLGETLAGLDLGASFTNVPGGTADWTFTDVTGNYTDDAGAADIDIGKAAADCTVSGVSVTYDGDPHGATGECLGVLGETLVGLDLGDTFTDVPGGTADWTFTDVTGNYTDDAGAADIDIGKADADCAVSGYSGTYDGTSHGATGECLGVLGETLAGLDLGSSFTNVPGGTADWTFTDVTGNYTDDAGSVAITIGKADADCSVSGYSGTYDGTSHGATGECLGVNGETLASLDLGDSFTDVPGGAADWILDNANYNAVSGSVDIEITRADAACNVSGVTVTFDGDPHGATGSCLGVNDEIISGLDRGDSFTDVPGGTADWALVNPNYNDASGSVTITITQAPQSIVFPPIPDATFGVPSFELTATTDSGLPITYTSLTSSVCTVSGSTVTIVGVGTCSIEASQPGDGNVLAAQSVVRTFAVAAADDTTPETSTRSSLAVIAGDGPFQRTVLIGLIAVGILAATIVLLGYRAGRYSPRRGVRG